MAVNNLNKVDNIWAFCTTCYHLLVCIANLSIRAFKPRSDFSLYGIEMECFISGHSSDKMDLKLKI